MRTKPYTRISDFEGHRVCDFDPYNVPSPAKFGNSPKVTEWEMEHGPGSGIYGVADWIEDAADADDLWAQAGNITGFQKPGVVA
jgi:hypothetical protein